MGRDDMDLTWIVSMLVLLGLLGFFGLAWMRSK